MKSFALILLGLVAPALSDITCGVAHGYDRGTNAYFYSGDGSLATFALCSAKCQSDSRCQSFAFGDSQCLLYSTPLDTNFREQSNSPFLFYDRDCTVVQSTSSFMTVMPSTTSAAVEASTTPAATATPATVTSQAGEQSTQSQDDGSSQDGSSAAGATSASGSSDAGGKTATGAGVFPASTTIATSVATGTSSSSGGANSVSSSGSGSSSSGTSTSTSTAALQSGGNTSGAPAVLFERGWWLGASIVCSAVLVSI